MNQFIRPAISVLLGLKLTNGTVEKRFAPLLSFVGRHCVAFEKYLYPQGFGDVLLCLWNLLVKVCCLSAHVLRGVPMSSGGVPMSSGGVPMSSGGGPMSSGGVPMSSGGVPMSSGGVPMSSGGVPMTSPVIPFLMPQDLEVEAVALRALKDLVTEEARLLLHLTSVSAPAA